MTDENFDNNNSNSEEPEEELIEFEGEFEPTMAPVKAAIFGLIAVFFLYQFGGAVLTLLIFGLDFESADVNAVRLLTMAAQVLLILLPGLMFAKLVYDDVGRVIRFKMPDLKGLGLFILGFIILTPLLQSFLYIQNHLIEIAADSFPFVEMLKGMFDELDKLVGETYSRILSSNSFLESGFIVLVVAVTPAICEEVFFRGFVQKSFEQKIKPFLAALITAIFFGLYHFSPYGLIGLTALGLYFGYAAYKSDSLLVPVVLHFLNNFFAVTLYILFDAEEYMDASAPPPEDVSQYVYSFFFFLALFLLLIFGIKKYYHTLSLNNKGEEQ